MWFMRHSGSSGAGNVIGTMFIGLAKQDAMRQNARLRDRALACLEKGSRCFGEDLDVTRQGALSAKAGQLGIVPGSMGARSSSRGARATRTRSRGSRTAPAAP